MKILLSFLISIILSGCMTYSDDTSFTDNPLFEEYAYCLEETGIMQIYNEADYDSAISLKKSTRRELIKRLTQKIDPKYLNHPKLDRKAMRKRVFDGIAIIHPDYNPDSLN